jgi:hypothetical protein
LARVRVYGLNFASAPANCLRIRQRSSVRATTCSWISDFVRAQPHWVCGILTGLPQARVRVNVSNIASDRAHSVSLGLELGLTGFGLGFEVRLGLAFTRFGFVSKVRLQSGLMFKLEMLIYIYF